MIKSIKIPAAHTTVPVQRCRCLRCGHTWKPTRPFKFSSRGNLLAGPNKCPRCHSHKWNLPYIRRTYRGRKLPIAWGMDQPEAAPAAGDADEGQEPA